MKFSWKALGTVALNVAKIAIPGVAQVEEIARAFPAMKGRDKQEAVLELVRQGLQISEGISGQDLISDPDVLQATKGFIDAYVALQNIVAKKAAQPS